ncbi:UvrD-helicase domain-containing protein [Pseudomonas sp. 2023EL-01195]|uniref:UvrD-helicase domain-containing protein n=1 Tax=Pseudomonas sp. 2023EL-01195 TaxID=3088134 RepID=UPI00041D2932|nr:UvrD-helicase domain-containing protein [Pseudomonas sp. 2023EL-01195]MDN4145664.1 UvrD-helicase domain-containing protein [Pseudomonas tohonis]MDW3716300.1 UvrD-helicase domain-containing protein [Pseudomonas sp. 2023EL-01195]
MPPEIDLFAIERGSITAPAGCGKTQLIAETLIAHRQSKPILVLTHTNAGVAALRARLRRAGVPNSAYRVSTIDGFSMRLIAKFPARSGHNPQILQLHQPNTDYPAIREAAMQLLQAGHLAQPLRATYARLLVDEYQDCNVVQHAIVSGLAQVLPTCVLGDPMQAIFDFRGNRLVHWANEVQPLFPAAGELRIPWRWRLAGAENLGQWLLAIRQQLQAGQPVDLRTAPAEVRWVQLNAGTEVQQRLVAARTEAPNAQGSVLIIGDSINVQGRHQLTSQTPGAMAVEAVDLRDLVNFARNFDLQGANALAQLVEFASSVMTGVGANLRTRVESLRAGRARTPPTAAEAAAIDFVAAPTLGQALRVIDTLAEQHGARVYRPEVLYCCRSAMQAVVGGAADFLSAAIQARERNRHLARPIARRSVGSTLLLKGLEADVSVVLHPELMTPQNLYVALTRGARHVVVCSPTPILTPVVNG